MLLPEFEWSITTIAGGLFKKMVLADALALYADAAFDHPGVLGTGQVWLGVYAFAFQIFFDVSGYTDIARGCAKLLGYDLPENFLNPYASESLSDFWRRWHITLSSWLRDYLYIPLGGNRMRTQLGVYRNLMVTMLLGGLWHGASWTFLLWGGIHGTYLVVERLLGAARISPGHWLARALRFVIVFHLVTLAWIPFRSTSIAQMIAVLRGLCLPHGPVGFTPSEWCAAFTMVIAWVWQLTRRLGLIERGVLSFARTARLLTLAGAFSIVLNLTIARIRAVKEEPPRSFIYFRF